MEPQVDNISQSYGERLRSGIASRAFGLSHVFLVAANLQFQ